MNSQQVQPLTVRIPEACRITGIGRSKLCELIKAGEISIVKVGTITLVPVESLRRFLGSEVEARPVGPATVAECEVRHAG